MNFLYERIQLEIDRLLDSHQLHPEVYAEMQQVLAEESHRFLNRIKNLDHSFQFRAELEEGEKVQKAIYALRDSYFEIFEELLLELIKTKLELIAAR